MGKWGWPKAALCGRNRTPKTSHAQESRATHAGYKTWIWGAGRQNGRNSEETGGKLVEGLVAGDVVVSNMCLFSTLFLGRWSNFYQFDELRLFSLGFLTTNLRSFRISGLGWPRLLKGGGHLPYAVGRCCLQLFEGAWQPGCRDNWWSWRKKSWNFCWSKIDNLNLTTLTRLKNTSQSLFVSWEG